MESETRAKTCTDPLRTNAFLRFVLKWTHGRFLNEVPSSEGTIGGSGREDSKENGGFHGANQRRRRTTRRTRKEEHNDNNESLTLEMTSSGPGVGFRFYESLCEFSFSAGCSGRTQTKT